VEITARGEVGDDGGGDVRRRAAPAEACGEVARGPGAAGQEGGGCGARGPRGRGSARAGRARYAVLEEELPAGGAGDGGRAVVRCSNDCSPVEKMPRTFRSKSSALVAASRAVS